MKVKGISLVVLALTNYILKIQLQQLFTEPFDRTNCQRGFSFPVWSSFTEMLKTTKSHSHTSSSVNLWLDRKVRQHANMLPWQFLFLAMCQHLLSKHSTLVNRTHFFSHELKYYNVDLIMVLDESDHKMYYSSWGGMDVCTMISWEPMQQLLRHFSLSESGE